MQRRARGVDTCDFCFVLFGVVVREGLVVVADITGESYLPDAVVKGLVGALALATYRAATFFE